jgi:hypothetical protein
MSFLTVCLNLTFQKTLRFPSLFPETVNRYGLEAVNMAIGLKIKEQLSLENDCENNSPKSRLIKSYTCHRRGKN